VGVCVCVCGVVCVCVCVCETKLIAGMQRSDCQFVMCC